jgi:2-phosphoglycerate kinase
MAESIGTAPRDLTVHVLYGIPCAGKSTTALALAHYRGIRTVLHTDYLRQIQRGYVPADRDPVLWKETHSAWELHGQPTDDAIVRGFLQHADAVAPAIALVAARIIADGFSAVIEGAHFHSGTIAVLRAAHPSITIDATLLAVDDVDALRRRIEQKENARARGGDAKNWRERMSVMLTIQNFLIGDARHKDIRVVTADELEDSWEPRRGRSTSTMS